MNDIIRDNITLYWRWMRIGVVFPRQMCLFWPNAWRL